MHSLRRALERLAFDEESRRLCLFYQRGLRSKVRIIMGGAQ